VGDIVGAYVEPAQCHGCGICVSECPAKAIQLLHYEDVQVGAEINALLEECPLLEPEMVKVGS
jgi:heterodisulfide reductase subunit A-like polyferredoxin